jgi:hypothetical protein
LEKSETLTAGLLNVSIIFERRNPVPINLKEKCNIFNSSGGFTIKRFIPPKNVGIKSNVIELKNSSIINPV